MSWGGSALAANQIIKNNRAMLKKRREKRKLSLFTEINEQWVDPKKASFEQLMEIRKRICREHKIRMRKVIVLAALGFVLLVLIWGTIPWDLIFTYTN